MTSTIPQTPPLVHAYDPDAGREGLARVWPDGTATFFPGRSHYGMRCMARDLVLGCPEDPLDGEAFWEDVTQYLLGLVRRLQAQAA